MNSETITQYSDDSEKWNFKMEWCRKVGLNPSNDLSWELAERAYARRHFDCSPAAKQNKGN